MESTRRERQASTAAAEPGSHPMAQPQDEHRWLQQLVGEWTYETDAQMKPDEPPTRFTGTEAVRSLGGLWVLGEGKGEMPGGGEATTLLTLGYDPQQGHFVGSWIGSMMTNMFVYRGELDAARKRLTLHTEGPSMAAEGKTARYREVIELKSSDERLFTSHMEGDDGSWQQLMTARYRRVGRRAH